MPAALLVLTADAPDGGVSISNPTYAILLGIAAIITAFATPFVAYLVGRRKASEDEVPKLRRELRRQGRDIEDLQSDVLNMSHYAFVLQQVALSKGVPIEDLPPAPVLRLRRPRRDAEETG